MGIDAVKALGQIVVVPKPLATRTYFGPIEDIAGKTLTVVDRARDGACLCLADGAQGLHLVDVEACDIAQYYFVPQ